MPTARATTGAIINQGFNDPGWLRICPFCGRWFALEPFRCELDPFERELCYYLCKHCTREVAFLQHARRERDWI